MLKFIILCLILINYTDLMAITYTYGVKSEIKWKSNHLNICFEKNAPEKINIGLLDAITWWNRQVENPIFTSHCPEKNLTSTPIILIKIHVNDFSKISHITSFARTEIEYDENDRIISATIHLNLEYYPLEKFNVHWATILAHELGHALGLKHNFFHPKSLMNYYPYIQGESYLHITQEEKNFIQNIYFKKSNIIPTMKDYSILLAHKYYTKTIMQLKHKKNRSDLDEYFLAMAYKQKKQFKNAAHHFERAIKIHSSERFYRLQYQELLQEQGKWKEALTQNELLLTFEPQSYEAHANLAIINFKLKNLEQSKYHIKKCLDIQPYHWAIKELEKQFY